MGRQTSFVNAVAALFLGFTSAFAHAGDRPTDIVDLHEVDPTILVEMMYFTPVNFIGAPILGYGANRCLLSRSAAIALKSAQERLRFFARVTGDSLSLSVRDCYRPKKAVDEFVEWVGRPDEVRMKSMFYPDLSKPELLTGGYIAPLSGHSRASTVDLTLVRTHARGEYRELPMGTIVDFFGIQSHTDYPDLSPEEKENRRLLVEVMSPEFKNYAKEWWHFGLRDEPYPKTYFDFDID
jgi:zinc D-Ala-D-Ala dipeptidase